MSHWKCLVISLIANSQAFVHGQEDESEYAFINPSGEIVLRDGWIDAGDFSEGVAGVKKEAEGKWGLIDTDGKLLVPYQWRNLPVCSEGAIKIRQETNDDSPLRFGFADKTGRMIHGFQWEMVSDFHDGLAEFSSEENFKSGFIDKSGRIAIPAIWDFVMPFSEGIALVEDETEGKYYFIDKTGQKLHGGRAYQDALSYSNGLAAVQTNGKWGAINRQGDSVIPAEWNSVGIACRESGLIPVSKNGRHAYLDQLGKIAIELKPWDDAGPFVGGLAEVVENGKTGFINTTGELVIPCEWDEVGGSFSETLCPVSKKGEWGYLDKAGQIVIPLHWKEAKPFNGGLARIRIR